MLAMLLWAIVAMAADTPPDPATAALQHIASLAGDWRGTMQWSGARSDSGPMAATYVVTSGGSAVIEILKDDGVPSMTSVYHLDNGALRMTHYCAARNQPRLKASRIDGDRIDFEYVDATNLKSPLAPHVDGFSMQFDGAGHVTLRFHFIAADKASVETIELRR